MVRLVRLSRTGNSLAIVIPRVLVRGLGWNRGELLACAAIDGALRVKRIAESELMSALADGAAAPPRRRRS